MQKNENSLPSEPILERLLDIRRMNFLIDVVVLESREG